MRRFVLLLPVLVCGAAAPLPARQCVPTALLDLIAAHDARQPWAEVSAIMDGLRELARSPVSCPDPAPASASQLTAPGSSEPLAAPKP